ncbi:MAG: MmgE/PrpD family protein [Sphaerochaetaceae bacterium]
MMETENTYLQRLGSFVSGLRFENLPREVVAKANDAWFDLIGCYYAALKKDPHPRLIDYALDANPLGQATMWGTGRKASLSQTVMTEGFICYALEFDDGVSLGGHWGSASIPTAFACTETMGGDGKLFLTSIVSAYEVGTRISRRFSSYLLKHNVHFPCAMGSFAAAAAAAKAFGLGAAETAMGLANGCLSPIGPYGTAVSGEAIKNMYSGWPNLVGLQMMEFARLGIGGDIDAMETNNGLAAVLRGTPLSAEEKEQSLRDLGEHFMVMESYCKPFPCCRWLHAPLMLLKRVIADNPGKAIRSMTVRGPKFLRLYDTKGDFTKKVKAQYSIPFTLAAMQKCGKLGIDEFEMPNRTREDIRKVADTVEIVEDERKERDFPGHFSVELEVAFADGTRESRDGGLPWSPENPPAKQELMDKFCGLVHPILTQAETDAWCDLYEEGVEKEGNFAKMLRLLGKDKR